MEKPLHRKPRFRRALDLAPPRLTERDFLILRIVARYRLIQSHQITRLIPGSAQNILRRLGKLFHAGYLDRPVAQLSVPICPATFAYSIASPAIRLLQASNVGLLATRARVLAGLMIPHALRVSEVLSLIERAAANDGRDFIHSPGELPLIESRALPPNSWSVTLGTEDASERIAVIPDAAFVLGTPSEPRSNPSYFFLEVDRGTMPIRRKGLATSSIYRKILAYRETRKRGLLRERFGINGFRILFACESVVRLSSIKEACREIHGNITSQMFLFSTSKDLLANSVNVLGEWSTSDGTTVSI